MWTLIGSLKCQHRTIGVKIPLQNIPSTNNCINSQNSSWYHTTNSWTTIVMRATSKILDDNASRQISTSSWSGQRKRPWTRPYLSFGWFRRPSQIPIMIQSKLFPIWNNAKWDSSCKTTRSRSNRNWYKILHFYKLYSLRFFLKILFFENLNSLYSRGRLKKSYPSSGMVVEKLVLLTTVWWVIYLVFTKYHALYHLSRSSG